MGLPGSSCRQQDKATGVHSAVRSGDRSLDNLDGLGVKLVACQLEKALERQPGIGSRGENENDFCCLPWEHGLSPCLARSTFSCPELYIKNMP